MRKGGDPLPAEPDGDDGAERRAGGDAERVRRRQRVAEHGLKQRARQRQCAAGQQAQERPRQPQLHENRPVRLLMRADAAQAEREWADERQQQGGRNEQHREGPHPPRGLA
jgi:hypothetical protein